MKLVRFRHDSEIRPGILTEEGMIRDTSRVGCDYSESFFERSASVESLENFSTDWASDSLHVLESTELVEPLTRPSKIVCVGLNYARHAAESGSPVPEEPILFLKSSSAVSGPFDPIQLPQGSSKVDWEVELAVVISKAAKNVAEEDAYDHIFGYTIHNDVSERAWQLERGGQWAKGKGADTFAPLGPYLVTKDEIPDPHSLDLWLKVNGETMQSSNTADMIFSVPFLISYISQFMTLLPGDVVTTGTPEGVGMGCKPEPRYLKAGDEVTLGITGLGEQRQEVVDA